MIPYFTKFTRLYLCFLCPDKPISGGKLLVEVSLFGIHIRTETHDICEETNCPISPGKFEISHSQDLPGITPPVSHLSGYDSVFYFHFFLYIRWCMVPIIISNIKCLEPNFKMLVCQWWFLILIVSVLCTIAVYPWSINVLSMTLIG